MNVKIIIGLPGSGKTVLANRLARCSVGPVMIVDDPKVEPGKVPFPEPGDWNTLILADPNLCDPYVLQSAVVMLREFYKDAEIDLFFFENDAAKARINVHYRGDGRNVEPTLRLLARVYKIPEGVVPIPIWQPE